MTRHEPHGLPEKRRSARHRNVKQAPKLVWQEAPLRKPLCEDMRVQLGRASRERFRRSTIAFSRGDDCIITEWQSVTFNIGDI
ncbi:unnamed protein product [Lasius platythorax]|uniref:Uncharacterized protein n=1 Tax=Lasius platythorax TaxID=488582 RepID=A0AAV2N2K1_9HYME